MLFIEESGPKVKPFYHGLPSLVARSRVVCLSSPAKMAYSSENICKGACHEPGKRFVWGMLACLLLAIAGCAAPVVSPRETPVVRVVRDNAVSVVNIRTESLVDLKEHPAWGQYGERLDRFFKQYFGEDYSEGTVKLEEPRAPASSSTRPASSSPMPTSCTGRRPSTPCFATAPWRRRRSSGSTPSMTSP